MCGMLALFAAVPVSEQVLRQCNAVQLRMSGTAVLVGGSIWMGMDGSCTRNNGHINSVKEGDSIVTYSIFSRIGGRIIEIGMTNAKLEMQNPQ